MAGAVFAGDLVTFFVHWEVIAVASVFLIWSSRTEHAYRAGMRYLVIQIGSGVLLLAGILVHYQATGSLAEWLAASGIPVIEGVDTRRLTRHIREAGAMRGVIAPGTGPTDSTREALFASPRMEGQGLASLAGADAPYTEGKVGPHVVAWDFGMKRNIVRMLAATGCRITVVPPRTTAEAIRALKPDGIFLSNGPGDPASPGRSSRRVTKLLAPAPGYGICGAAGGSQRQQNVMRCHGLSRSAHLILCLSPCTRHGRHYRDPADRRTGRGRARQLR